MTNIDKEIASVVQSNKTMEIVPLKRFVHTTFISIRILVLRVITGAAHFHKWLSPCIRKKLLKLERGDTKYETGTAAARKPGSLMMMEPVQRGSTVTATGIIPRVSKDSIVSDAASEDVLIGET